MIRFAGLTGTETVSLLNVSVQATPQLTSYINTIQPGGLLQFITQGDGYALTVGPQLNSLYSK